MKRKILIIEEYQVEKSIQVQQLISSIVKEGDINLLLRLKCFDISLSAKLLDHIADTIKAVGKEYEFVVDIILETNQWKNVKALRNKLNRYSISVELEVAEKQRIKEILRYSDRFLLEKILLRCKDFDTFYQKYQQWKNVEVPIDLVDYELTHEEYLQFFEMWIHDAKATWFTPFEDIISSMLTGVPSGMCEHNSCMGKYLYLDKNSQVYFCAKKKDHTQMYSLSEVENGPIYNEKYANVLHSAIEKRNQCVEECQLFSLCRGGCPFVQKTAKTCAEYAQKVARIGEFIEKEIGDSFANIENPCVRQLYLSLIAYGFSFQQQEEAEGI